MRLSDILESDHGIHPASRFAVATECQRVNGEIMNEEQFRSDNHYLPCLYLKHFATSNERVSVYRTLVAHDRFPMWREKPIKGVAYRAHLYTRLAAGRDRQSAVEGKSV